MFSKLTKKVFRCPQCSQKLRVPIRPGKTLRVTCNKCFIQFDVSFKNPFLELFQWERGRTLKYNLEGLRLRFKAMTFGDKINALMTIFIIILFLNLLVLGALSAIQSLGEKPIETLPKDKDHYEVI